MGFGIIRIDLNSLFKFPFRALHVSPREEFAASIVVVPRCAAGRMTLRLAVLSGVGCGLVFQRQAEGFIRPAHAGIETESLLRCFNCSMKVPLLPQDHSYFGFYGRVVTIF